MDWHVDNPILSCAIQIYLFDFSEKCGTTFLINNQPVKLPFVSNTGYIANHNVQENVLHKPSCVVPAGLTRYSLYASWSFTEKLPS